MNIRAKHCLRCGDELEKKVHREDGGEKERLSCPDCGWVFYDNPTPVVAALVEHEGDVLLVRNKGWPESWYGLVTGYLEREEHPEAGALRELKEELSLEGEILSLIGVYPFPMKNELIIAYHVRAEGEVVLGEEIASYKRVPPNKLRPWPFATGDAVRDWLKKRSE